QALTLLRYSNVERIKDIGANLIALERTLAKTILYFRQQPSVIITSHIRDILHNEGQRLKAFDEAHEFLIQAVEHLTVVVLSLNATEFPTSNTSKALAGRTTNQDIHTRQAKPSDERHRICYLADIASQTFRRKVVGMSHRSPVIDINASRNEKAGLLKAKAE